MVERAPQQNKTKWFACPTCMISAGHPACVNLCTPDMILGRGAFLFRNTESVNSEGVTHTLKAQKERETDVCVKQQQNHAQRDIHIRIRIRAYTAVVQKDKLNDVCQFPTFKDKKYKHRVHRD